MNIKKKMNFKEMNIFKAIISKKAYLKKWIRKKDIWRNEYLKN